MKLFWTWKVFHFLSELAQLPNQVTHCWSSASLNFTLCVSLHRLAVVAHIHSQILVSFIGQ